MLIGENVHIMEHVNAERAGKTSGTQRHIGGIHDEGRGSDTDGSERTPYQRMLAAYREEGAAALAHGNRGRRPANATPEGMADAVVRLARTKYTGVNHTHLSELLGEREGIEIGRSTLHRLLVSAGVSSPRSRRPPKHRVRRQRMSLEGMLIQIDGSHHRWLGKDGPQFTLLIAVDDATGCVAGALFCLQETTSAYFQMLEGLRRLWTPFVELLPSLRNPSWERVGVRVSPLHLFPLPHMSF